MATSKKVRIEDLGLYIRTIQMDYKPKNNEQLAELISEHFNVICDEEDLEQYNVLYDYHEELYKAHEDYELEDRRINYFRQQGLNNPFY